MRETKYIRFLFIDIVSANSGTYLFKEVRISRVTMFKTVTMRQKLVECNIRFYCKQC